MTGLLVKLALIASVILLALAWIGLGVSRSRRRRREEAAAARAFILQQGDLHGRLVTSLAPIPTDHLGEVDPHSLRMVRDRATGSLLALVAFRHPSKAADPAPPTTVVFTWHHNRWETEGRQFAGMTPDETQATHARYLVPVAGDGESHGTTRRSSETTLA